MQDCEVDIASVSRSREEPGHEPEAVLRYSEDTSFSISSSTSSGQGENLMALVTPEGPGEIQSASQEENSGRCTALRYPDGTEMECWNAKE